MNLVKHLSEYIAISVELEKALLQNAKRVEVAAHEKLCLIDKPCKDLFFIEKGLLRGYYYEDGKEITNWFGQENEFGTCFYSFITQSPSFENIEALEDCILYKISFSDLQSLYANYPETERIGRIITETYYIKLEERILGLQFKTAKERYARIIETKPSLLQRTSLGQIASYLGITQETLSRIRADIN